MLALHTVSFTASPVAQSSDNRSNAGEDFPTSHQSSHDCQTTANSEVLDYICKRFAELGGVSNASVILTLSIDDVGVDSLELTELIMDIEDRFSVVIDDTNLSGSTKISSLASLISTSLIR